VLAVLAVALLVTYLQTAPAAPLGPGEAFEYDGWVSGVQSVQPLPPGSTLAAAILAAAFAFVAGRGLLNAFWGLVLALLIALHPLFFHLVKAGSRPIAVAAVELGCLALLVTAWPLAFAERPRWRLWLALIAGLALFGALAWLLSPFAGFVVAAGEGVVLGVAFVLAVLRRRGTMPAPRPAVGNMALSLLGALAAPVLGFAAAPFAVEAVDWLGNHGMHAVAGMLRPESPQDMQALLHAIAVREGGYTLPGFTPEALRAWCWPTPWVVLPLAAWGLWRAVRRGRKQWSSGTAPVSWVLPPFGAVMFLATALGEGGWPAASLLQLAVLGVLLAVYCLGDLVRGVAERMMLGPPPEGAAAAE
jgi:hypothetical protein